MIPRILHTIWLGDQSKRPQTWIDSWKNLNPTYQHILWTEENLPKSVAPKQYEECPGYSGKSDIMRYQLLYEHGGIYIDADSECIRPLEDDLLDNEAFCSWENEYVNPGLMLGSHMGSVKGNPFFQMILEEIQTLTMPTNPNETWFAVGPGLLTRMVSHRRYNRMKIYPSHYFSPTHHSGLEYEGDDRVFSNHYWSSTPKRSATLTKHGFEY